MRDGWFALPRQRFSSTGSIPEGNWEGENTLAMATDDLRKLTRLRVSRPPAPRRKSDVGDLGRSALWAGSSQLPLSLPLMLYSARPAKARSSRISSGSLNSSPRNLFTTRDVAFSTTASGATRFSSASFAKTSSSC
jgi:hypothetical protein